MKRVAMLAGICCTTGSVTFAGERYRITLAPSISIERETDPGFCEGNERLFAREYLDLQLGPNDEGQQVAEWSKDYDFTSQDRTVTVSVEVEVTKTSQSGLSFYFVARDPLNRLVILDQIFRFPPGSALQFPASSSVHANMSGSRVCPDTVGLQILGIEARVTPKVSSRLRRSGNDADPHPAL